MTAKHLNRKKKKFHSKLFSLHTVENGLYCREEQEIVNSRSLGRMMGERDGGDLSLGGGSKIRKK